MINENCPACFEAPKERHHIKKLLAREEGVFPSLYPSLRKALIPLLDPAAMDLLAAVQKTVEEASEGTRRAMRQRGARLDNGKNGKKDKANAAKSDAAALVAPQPLENRSGNAGNEQVTAGAGWENDGERHRGQNLSLSEATEHDLLAELVRRRQAVRAGGRLSSDANNEPLSAPASGITVMTNGDVNRGNSQRSSHGVVDDRELNGELVELQTFCSADGCERRPIEL